MGSIMDKLKEMEDREEPQHRLYTKPLNRENVPFMQLYAAALTGVISHVESDKHGDKELVEQAYSLATIAYKRVKA